MIKIGLSCNWDSQQGIDSMPRDYVNATLRAGALPLILPLIDQNAPDWEACIESMANSVDGLIFTGGPDFDPQLYGEEKQPYCGTILESRDRQDIALFSAALKRKLPFLAICRGVQLVNVAMGGALYQDIAAQKPDALDHAQFSKKADRVHKVSIAENSLLSQVMGVKELGVNSRHHQAVSRIAPGLKACALSPDGLCEALEFENGYPALGVQWHPENLSCSCIPSQKLFDWLVKQAKTAL